jgi:hypothetical protein
MIDLETIKDNFECTIAKYEKAFDLLHQNMTATAVQLNTTASRDARKLIMVIEDEIKLTKKKK